MNRACEVLGIENPVVQAPMLWLTSLELAAAVSSVVSLVKSIDSCSDIVAELARGY